LVVRQHKVFTRVARVLGDEFPPDPADGPLRVLLLLALTHGAGQYHMVATLYRAGTLCIPNGIDTAASLAEVRALDPHVLPMGPRVLRSLSEQRASNDTRLFGPSARMLFVGGSASRVELLHQMVAEGIEIGEGYGASEISILAQTRRGRWKEGTVGEILPDVSLKLAEDGELLARSPGGRMIGYFGDDALTQQAFTPDGYYHTGDYCEIGADGYLRYIGRKHDVFNTFEGANVHPGRIEAMLEALPWVRQVLLIGDQRPFIAALMVLRDEHSNDPDGYLEERGHPSAYARARAELGRLNEGLESVERVRAVALFGAPFPEQMYRPVGQGKIGRDRRQLGIRYAPYIDAMYAADRRGRIDS
jgi:long-chain acyl-CoA synthetase